MKNTYSKLKAPLLLARFRKDYDVFISTCLADKDFLDSIMHDLIYGTERVQFVSARLIQLLVDEKHELVEKYDESILKLLSNTMSHSSIRRTALRVFMKINLREEIHAELIDSCINRLMDRNDAIACRVFAIHVLLRLTKHYPDLAQEISPYLRENMPFESAAFSAAGRNYLKISNKLRC
jgi:hypothetical protein